MPQENKVKRAAEKVAKVGDRVVAPDDNSARGIAARNKTQQEYEDVYGPVLGVMGAPTLGSGGASSSPKPMDVDKLNNKLRTNENRIPQSELDKMLRPISAFGSALPRVHEDVGPVKNDVGDGHHELAVVQQGERILSPGQNEQYERWLRSQDQQGAPSDFGGRVLQQPNPAVRPMTDEERENTRLPEGASFDLHNPSLKEGVSFPSPIRVFDDGGVAPDPMNLPQDAFDPSGANIVGQSAIDSAAQAAPESRMHKIENGLQQAGKAMPDPSDMPGQEAKTHQYAIQGLDRNYMTPVMDDGGKISMNNNETHRNGIPKIALAKIPGTPEYRDAKAKGFGSALNVPVYDSGAYVMGTGAGSGAYDESPELDRGMSLSEAAENANALEGTDAQNPDRGVTSSQRQRTVDQTPLQDNIDLGVPQQPKPFGSVFQPKMTAPGGVSSAAPEPPSATNMPAGAAKPDAANTVGESSMMAPEHNPMATTTSAMPLPNEREKLEAERAALKQKMVDAAIGVHNNGEFDILEYGRTKMALADLNKAYPWGQPGNHDSILGKIGHDLAVAGELASDVVLGPGFTSAIPGSRENLNRQASEGQEQVTQGLAGKASEAETQLKQAQAQTAGRPKDPKQGIAFETFNVSHTEPGSPEHQRALDNLAFYQEQDRKMNENKQAAKPELLPQDIAAQTRKVLSLPQGSPERAQAEQDLQYMEKQAQQAGKLTDRHREIIDAAIQHGLNPDDPDQYAQAVQLYEGDKVKTKGEAGMPVWKSKAAIQNEYATQRALLLQNNAKADEYGIQANKERLKADEDFSDKTASFRSTKRILATADDNTVAANVIPMLMALGIVSTEGKVKRMNATEYSVLSPAAGSAYRWAAAHADRISAGQLPDGYKKDVNRILDELIQEQRDVRDTKFKGIDTYLTPSGQQPEVKTNKKGGTTVAPKKAPATPPTENTPTSGGTISPAEWLKQKKARQAQ